MTNQEPKSNEAWDQLCDITTRLVPQYGARRRAFAAACEQRPDLAASAVDPLGMRLRGVSAAKPQPPADPAALIRAICELADRKDAAAFIARGLTPEEVAAELMPGVTARSWKRIIAQLEGRRV